MPSSEATFAKADRSYASQAWYAMEWTEGPGAGQPIRYKNLPMPLIGVLDAKEYLNPKDPSARAGIPIGRLFGSGDYHPHCPRPQYLIDAIERRATARRHCGSRMERELVGSAFCRKPCFQ